jgi:hypothetical protein
MLDINLDEKNIFKEYSEQIVKELLEDSLPVILCGDTLEEQLVPWFERNGVQIDNWYDGDRRKRGKQKFIGGGAERAYLSRGCWAIVQ